jgi:hypothetical protein
MGPQHVRDGVLSIRQQKTGTEVVIPVHGNLQASLDTSQAGEMVFLLNLIGAPSLQMALETFSGMRLRVRALEVYRLMDYARQLAAVLRRQAVPPMR